MKRYIEFNREKNEDLVKKNILEMLLKNLSMEYPNFIEIEDTRYILTRKGVSRLIIMIKNCLEDENWAKEFTENSSDIKFMRGDSEEFYTYYRKVCTEAIKDYKELLVEYLLDMILNNDKRLKLYFK